ncbi:MAG: hypothetical protein QXW94_05285 [Desulfurococcaceae archaeon]
MNVLRKANYAQIWIEIILLALYATGLRISLAWLFLPPGAVAVAPFWQ